MNNIIFLVVRSLYSLVVVFFFVFTIQSAVAAGKYDAVIQDISGYITRDGLWSNELPDMKSLPATDKALRDKILAIKDADGNNIAHKVLRRCKNTDEILQVFRVVGIEAFREKNTAGLKSFEENPQGLESIFQPDAILVAGQASLLTTLQNSLKPFIPSAVQREMAGYLVSKQTLDQLRREESVLPRLEWNATTDLHETKRADLSERIRGLNDDLERISGSLASLVVCLDGSVVQSLGLEQIDIHNFYYRLSQTEAGIKLLKSYRTSKGKTLYNYFSEKESQSEETEDLLSRLIIPFILDGQVPTPDKVDIKKLSRRLTGCFQSGPTDLRLKPFFEQYKNRQGQNLAFLAAAADDVRFLQEEMQSKGVDVMAMLQVKDIHGNDGISQITNAYDVVDPRLRELIEAKEQEKFLHQEEARLKAEGDFEAMPLNDDLWNAAISVFEIANPGVFEGISLRSVLNKGSSPLRDSFLQQNPTDFSGQAQANQLWKSFFTTYDDLERLEREKHYHNDGVFVCGESMLSPPVRVLNVFQRFGQNGMMGQELSPAIIETIRALQSNVLATGGTFGMNFNRTANEHEANIMIEGLDSLGRAFQEATKSYFDDILQQFQAEFLEIDAINERVETLKDNLSAYPINSIPIEKAEQELRRLNGIILGKLLGILKESDPSFSEEITEANAEKMMHRVFQSIAIKKGREIADTFFVKYLGNMTVEQMFKLEAHQTNCAVIILYSCFEGNFDVIDEVLADRLLMRNKSASYYKSSKQRYEDVMQMAGRYHVGGYDDGMGEIPLPHSGGISRSHSGGVDDIDWDAAFGEE